MPVILNNIPVMKLLAPLFLSYMINLDLSVLDNDFRLHSGADQIRRFERLAKLDILIS